MKVAYFYHRQDKELSDFLLLDGESINIKFITDCEVRTRVYYNEIGKLKKSAFGGALLSYDTIKPIKIGG